MPETYRPKPQLLKKLCFEHSQKKIRRSQFKVNHSNIIYEAKTKQACHNFQQAHTHRLPINALSTQSVIQTVNGWALIAPLGRPRKEA